ncbi:MAG: S8 family serine peptidase [Deltaproteobacteria bacterium]|nr:S8 family serine peptidase [Deltaproteobacteria bacterium]MBI3293702.1 S8 family serine peptidase [Deltaproteobacteria bacterium]
MRLWIGFVALIAVPLFGANELLIKFKDGRVPVDFLARYGGTLSSISPDSQAYKWTSPIGARIDEFQDDSSIALVQKNHAIHLMSNPSLERNRAALLKLLDDSGIERGPAYEDNPKIENPVESSQIEDPQLSEAWGLSQVGVPNAWKQTQQGSSVVVAVSDTGVDYNHEDLIKNMWRNPAETPGDGIDNDGNGYVDDIVGWDFAKKDALPYDLSMSIGDILFKGGNPGHGSHVSGVIASQLNNGKGAAGVAPKASIMAVRFISEEGGGDTAGAIGAIDYAVKNGAQVINASWGSEGAEEGDALLRESIQRAEAKGVIFVAAAGNGRSNGMTEPTGYNNDTDPKPVYPCAYPYTNVVCVAATANTDTLAPFSNFGKKTVMVAAPGIKILSTVPGNRYQHTIIDLGQIKVTWDGTSMSAPFVSGALAVLISQNPSSTYTEIIEKLTQTTLELSDLKGKVGTDARLDLGHL